MESIPIYFERNGLPYEGCIEPVNTHALEPSFRLRLYGRVICELMLTGEGWKSSNEKVQHLAWFFGMLINEHFGTD